jgi:hypothetical protein
MDVADGGRRAGVARRVGPATGVTARFARL